MKKLFLIDAYALIYRAYYAFLKAPMRSPSGQNVSAIFGFAKFVNDIIAKEQPDLLGVAFDPKGGTFRNELYPEYKAHRSETPEVIIQSTPIIKDILTAMRIPILEVEGFEADDVIGTLSHKASQTGLYTTYMVTPDKDYGQLVRDNVLLYKPSKKGAVDVEIVDVKQICETFSINHPQQFIDILALWGDASDNIPGVPGVGEKGACNLVSKYGDIENVIANADNLTPKQKESVTEYADRLRLAKQLATISLDVPIDLNEDELTLKSPEPRALGQIYRSLGFRVMLNDLQRRYPDINFDNVASRSLKPKVDDGQGSLFDMNNNIVDFDTVPPPAPAPVSKPATPKVALPTAPKTSVATPKSEKQSKTAEPVVQPLSGSYRNITNTPHSYSLLNSVDDVRELCRRIVERGVVCIDTETTSVEPMRALLVGMSVSLEPSQAYWIPRDKETMDIMREVLENPAVVKIGHNIKFDIMVLRIHGINVRGPLYDTMILHYLLDPESRHSLDFLSRNILDYDPIPIESLIGKGATQITMDRVDPELVCNYAAEDADITLQLYNALEPKITHLNQQELYSKIEEPLINVLCDMETIGVKIDTEILAEIRQKLGQRLAIIEEAINKTAGTRSLNINSPRQLGELLYNKLQISDKPKQTKTGQFKTDEETLQELKDRHPIIEQILEYRGLKKLLTTYVDALPLLVNPRTGRIHTSFNQAVTATGRLSSTNPNLQNIPIRDDDGKEIRRAIVPGHKNYRIIAADYSQVELRIMAHLSGDVNMLSAFAAGEDIHTATAAKIYNVPLAEVTKEQRRRAKTANFGIIYGISPYGLSQRLNIPRSEAKELIDSYFIHFPQVKQYMDRVAMGARDTGYVETIFGRRRYLNDINSSNNVTRSLAERNAINAPIQGSAADIMKLAMIGVWRRLNAENLKARILLQVHDEIVLEAPEDEVERVRVILREEMSGAATLSVPLDVDVGVGDNWLEAH